jgi:hypothetical protein
MRGERFVESEDHSSVIKLDSTIRSAT